LLSIFKIGSCKLFAWASLEPWVILLISASWVAQITGVSHWHLAPLFLKMWLWTSAAVEITMLRVWIKILPKNYGEGW
jgi:hypothetical protein